MIKRILLILIAISSLKSYSQIIFENGYFIDESNKRIECLIKNVDWRSNPTEFEYKFSDNESAKIANIKTVKEFGINNVSKFIRAKINIDRSSDKMGKMSSERNPAFKEELLFLKVLIEGKASLYQYTDGNLIRYFFKLDDSEINQLVYKQYLYANKIAVNNYFRQQLYLQLKCDEIEKNELKHLSYDKRDLERLFIKYNECTNSNYINHAPHNKKHLFNLAIRPGINYSSLEIQNQWKQTWDTDFENRIGISFGLEAEFILPFHKNKWGLIVESTYRYFKSEQTKETSNVPGGILVSKVDYKSVELPIGVRHYFYLNDKSKLYANISYVFEIQNNSYVRFFEKDNTLLEELEVSSGMNMALGIGYKYNNNYSIEIRYNTSRNIIGSYLSWYSDYRTVSVIFGYSFF
jgi:hypothetical protein